MYYEPNSSVVVTFKHLVQLANEFSRSESALAETIEFLAMWDIPMSDAVIKLGVIYGVLTEGYHNGWSKEVDD